MNATIFLQKCLIGAATMMLVWSWSRPVFSQILTKPDPDAKFDRSKGILVVHAPLFGSFFLNDTFLHDFKGNDTLYIINLECLNYTAKFVVKTGTHQNAFKLNRDRPVEITANEDTLLISSKTITFEDITEKIKGRRVYFIIPKKYFNITLGRFFILCFRVHFLDRREKLFIQPCQPEIL